MRKFRKKPVVIEAIQWDATKKTWDELIELGMDNWSPGPMGSESFYLDTNEGVFLVKKGDFVIKEPFDTERKFYPCKPDVFEKTYESLEGYKGQPYELTVDQIEVLSQPGYFEKSMRPTPTDIKDTDKRCKHNCSGLCKNS